MSFCSQKVSSFLKRAAVVAVGLAAVFAAGGARAAVKSSYDYVQDGLIAQWDGVENVSRLVHVSETNVWKDLVSGREFSLTGVTIGDACLTFAGNSTGSFGKLSAADTDQTFELAKNGTLEIVVLHASKNASVALQSSSDSGLAFGLYGTEATLSTGVSSPEIQNIDFYSKTSLITILYNNRVAASAYVNGVAQTLGGGDNWNNPGDETWIGRRATGANYPFAGSIYAIRIYSRKLTAKEIAANAAVDTARFVNGEYATGGFVVRGEPDGIGASSPAYGAVTPADGETVTCRASSPWVNTDQTARGNCIGWKLTQADGTVSSGDGTEKSITYTSDMIGAALTWRWSPEYTVKSSAEVSVSPAWVTPGATVTLTAVPPEGKVLSHWTNAVSGVSLFGNPLEVTVMGPTTILPVFSTPRYVTTDGNDDSGSGTASAPYASIAKALSVAEPYDVVIVSNGTYSISSSLSIATPVTVRGFSGDMADVTLNVTGGFRHFSLNHAEARLEALTINGGAVSGRGGVSIASDGGRIVKCLLVGNRASSGGALTMASANGFVANCVFSNNIYSANDTRGHAVNMSGGVIRNSLFVRNGKTAYQWGAGGVIYASAGRIESCSFYGNMDYDVPGVYAEKSAVVENCILGKGQALMPASAASPYYYGTASLFTSNVCPVSISAKNVVSDRVFRNAEAGDFLPGDGAQDAAAVKDWMTDAADLAGTNRVMGLGPDFGCYEMPVSFAKVTSSAVEGLSPFEVTFTVTTLEPCPQGVECEWDWNGDGTVDKTTSGTTTHEFPPGSYNVCVKVKDVATGRIYEPPTPMPVKSVPKTLYVAPTAAHSGFPYDTWETAATNLADAAACAGDGCEIVVSNGTYSIKSTISIEKGVTVRGLSGDPTDVTLGVTGGFRHFKLNNPSVAIKAVTITGGGIGGRGGVGICLRGGSVSNCVFYGNRNGYAASAGGPGAAIYMESSSGLVDHCVITNNSTGSSDVGNHGVYMTAGTVRNCLVINNGYTSYHWGGANGAICATGGRIESCSFYGNKDWKVPNLNLSSSVRVINCIIGPGIGGDGLADPSHIYYKGSALFYTNICPIAISGSGGNIKSDLCFRNAAAGDYIPGDDALDVAHVFDWMANGTDLDGRNRILGDGPDLGCYEKPVAFVKVSADATQGLAPLDVKYTVDIKGSCPLGILCEWDWNGDGTYEDTSDGTTNHVFAAGSYSVSARITNLATHEIYVSEVPMPLTSVPPVVYVATNAVNSAYPYDSWDKAATNLADAAALTINGCEIVISNGTHAINETVMIEKDVDVRGLTGDPADVILRVTGGIRHFILNHQSSSLTALSITGGGIGGRGGITIRSGGGTVSNCVFYGNRYTVTSQSGGALYMASGDALVTHCVFTNNACTFDSSGGCGGHAVYMTCGTLRDCLVANNGHLGTHYHAGGSVLTCGEGVRIENCSFYGNKDLKVPGVYVTVPSYPPVTVPPRVVNCILGGGTGGATMEKPSDAYYRGSASYFTTNICPVAFEGSVGHITSENIYKDAAAGDFLPGADAQDVADELDWMDGCVDLAGKARIQGDGPDLGCYEITPPLAKVTASATQGLAPATVYYTVTPKRECPQGILCAWDWNGDGEYEEETDGSTSHEFAAGSYSVRMKVTDVATGDVYDPGVPFLMKSVPPVMYVATDPARSAFPYDTWEKAATNLSDVAAFVIDGCEVIVSNGTYVLNETVTFDKNVTVRSLSGNRKDVTLKVTGSRRHLILNNASALFTGFTFDGDCKGGGIDIWPSGGRITACDFINNHNSVFVGFGGALNMNSANAFVDRCSFTSNRTTFGSSGGSAHVVGMAGGILRNCLVVDNGYITTHYHVGSVISVSDGRVENCSFYGNMDDKLPGVLVSPAYSKSPLVVNCILGPGVGGNGVATPSDIYYSGPASCFATNICPIAMSGSAGHITSDKIFKDAEKGKFQPGADAKEAAHHMDWMATSTDLSGRPRVFGKKPDLGCYECQVGGFTLIVR